MDMIGKIRRLHARDKLSEREIARKTGLSRNTVSKWLRAPVNEAPKYRRERRPNKLNAFEEMLKQALTADARRPKHERRTARALHTQIKTEGYTGGYSVPCELAGQMVSTRLYPGSVVVVADDAVVARHERLSNAGGTRYDWQHYIPLVQRKPGALRNGAPFADMPEALERLRRGLLRQAGGDRVMAQVLAIVPAAGLEAVIVAAELAMESCPLSGRVSVEHVVNVLGRLNAPSAAPLSAETALQVATPPLANTARYDRLRGQEVGHA